jgi:hypothetical protein
MQKPKLEKQLSKQEKLKEMGRLEVLSKKQEALKPMPAVDINSDHSEQEEKDKKVVNIVSKSWRNIISERK